MNRNARPILISLTLLSGCAGLSETTAPVAVFTAPEPAIVAKGLSAAATEAKLLDPLVASGVRPAGPLAPSAPGSFVACVKSSSADAARSSYAVFFKDNTYTSSRLALVPDGCSGQAYQPFRRLVDLKKDSH